MRHTKHNVRANEILRLLVEHYIREGQPIGSKTIAAQSDLNLSSATIRSIMADLENAGLVISPHTSAGRIPTAKGYRFFVNCLLQANVHTKHDLSQYLDQVDNVSDPKTLVESASGLISSITQLAGIVTVPKREHQILRHIEFLPLSNHRVLVILVFNEHEVQNRIIHTDRPYTKEELLEAAQFVLNNYAGKLLSDVRADIVETMNEERQSMDSWMQSAVAMAKSALDEEQDEGYIISGEANLLDSPDDLSKMRALFEEFAKKRSILHLLDQSMSADGLQIFIGQESGFDVLDGYSLITSPYSQGDVMGVLGVIGPTRMDYGRAIAAVDLTAKLISAAFKEEND